MWKCKHCGSDDYMVGYGMKFCRGSFDKDGNQYDSENDAYFPYEYVQCENCGKTADDIKNIADWVEEE